MGGSPSGVNSIIVVTMLVPGVPAVVMLHLWLLASFFIMDMAGLA